MTKIGAQLYTVRMHCQTPEDLAASFKKVADIGFKNVQISGIGKDIPVEFVAEQLKKNDLKCIVTHIQFSDITDNFEATVKKHKAWESPYIGIGGLPQEYRSEEGFWAFAKLADEWAKKLRDNGLQFVYHNHNFEFVKYGDKRALEILMENTSDAVQFEQDTYWVQKAGADPIEWIYKNKGRGDIIHFKDMGMGPERDNIMLSLGQGNMHYDGDNGILAACDACGVKYAFIEQDVCPKDPFECLKESRDFLMKYGWTD